MRSYNVTEFLRYLNFPDLYIPVRLRKLYYKDKQHPNIMTDDIVANKKRWQHKVHPYK